MDLILLTFSEKDTMEVWVNGVVVETAVSKIIIIHVHLTDDVLVSSWFTSSLCHALLLSLFRWMKVFFCFLFCSRSQNLPLVNSFTYNFQGEFVDDGTETHFTWANHTCYIKAISSGKKKDGIIHSLIIDSNEIPETMDEWHHHS